MAEIITFRNHGARLIAHRGCGLRVENTLPAFKLAGERPYFGIETDIHRTRDGRFIVFHDDDTERMTGQKHIVEETGYAALRSLRIPDPDHPEQEGLQMPSLEEYLHVCRDTKKTSVLELKNHMGPEDVDNIVDIVMNCSMLENIIFISFDLPTLVSLRSRLPEQPMQLLAGEDAGNLMADLTNYQLDLDIYYRSLTEKRFHQLHNAGIRVNVWTVDNPDDAEELSSWGVDYITTNLLESAEEDTVKDGES